MKDHTKSERMKQKFRDLIHLNKMRAIWNTLEYKQKISNSQPNKLNLSKEELYKLYIIQQKSTRDIAKTLGVCKYSILKYLKLYNIELRYQHQIKNDYNPTIADAAWLAGFIDGEGWFGISLASSGKEAKNKKWSLKVVIANCNKLALIKIQEILGSGCIMKRELSAKSENWSDCFAIQLCGKAIPKLLNLIEPHSIVKKDNIKLAKDYLHHQNNRKRGVLNEDEIKFRHDIKLKLSKLTKKFRKSKSP